MLWSVIVIVCISIIRYYYKLLLHVLILLLPLPLLLLLGCRRYKMCWLCSWSDTPGFGCAPFAYHKVAVYGVALFLFHLFTVFILPFAFCILFCLVTHHFLVQDLSAFGSKSFCLVQFVCYCQGMLVCSSWSSTLNNLPGNITAAPSLPAF